MRITHVTDFYLPRLGGLELQVADLAAQQARLGHEVTVVAASPSEGLPEQRPGVEVVRVTDTWRRPSPLHPRAPFAGLRAVLDSEPDVVHVHLGVGTPLAFWVARATARAGLPTATTVHSLWTGTYGIFKALDVPGGWSRGSIAWSAVSDAAAEPVRRLVSAPVTILPNGTSVDDWAVTPVARPDDEVVLAAVMRLARRKRPLPLLRMARELRERVPDDVRLRLVVVGDGPAREQVERAQARLGPDWVELAGRRTRSEIRDLYRRADVFVAPADLESFGIAALEARCAGVPVVAKAATGVASFVRHGVDGLLGGDDDDLVAHLARLCCDPALRARLRAAPPPRQLDWPHAVRAAMDLYARAGAVPDLAEELVAS